MVRRILLGLATLVATLGIGTAAQAQVQINEVFANPPGTDNGTEFFEIRSLSGGAVSMSGLSLIVIEGDGAAAGTIDAVFSLNAFSTGTNGLFLWRDSATVLVPNPNPATVINIADFNPDLENGSNTFGIVSGFTGAVGNDLDTNNDGTFDVPLPWTSAIDAIGVKENDGTPADDFSYGSQMNGADFPILTFTPDLVFRLQGSGAWYGVDVLGTSPGPFTVDPLNQSDIAGNLPAGTFSPDTATPGVDNPVFAAVPEPTTLALLGLVAGGFGARQWSKRRRTEVSE